MTAVTPDNIKILVCFKLPFFLDVKADFSTAEFVPDVSLDCVEDLVLRLVVRLDGAFLVAN
jgi:hypothetical protein